MTLVPAGLLDTLFLSTLTARTREKNENLFQKNRITIISLGHKKYPENYGEEK